MADTTTTTTTPENEKTIQLVRTGTFYDDKGKPFHLFHRVVDGALADTISFTITKPTKFITGVGTVWSVTEIDGSDGKRWRLGAAKYLRMWADNDLRLAWDAEQEIRDMDHNGNQRAKAAGGDSVLNKMLADLRGTYRSQVGANRAKFLAYVVKEIVR
jgi:hypothetical protein